MERRVVQLNQLSLKWSPIAVYEMFLSALSMCPMVLYGVGYTVDPLFIFLAYQYLYLGVVACANVEI